MDQKSEEFFARLKVELENTHTWPAEYLFKFIVPTDAGKIATVQNTFNGLGAVMHTKKSKNETYTSISVNVQMESAQSVIDKYLEVSVIEGIISL
jgi:hypothetical protein